MTAHDSRDSALLEADRSDSRFSPPLAWARERLNERLSVDRLAERAAMSPGKNLERDDFSTDRHRDHTLKCFFKYQPDYHTTAQR